jgi:hypothetical protein
MPDRKNKLFRIAASLFLLIAAGVEANHSFVDRVPWNGFTLASNNFSLPYIVVWCLGIVGIWSHKAVLKPLMFFGIFFLFMHGAIIALGGNTLVGGLYLGLAALSGLCAAASHRNESARIQRASRPNLRIAS